MMIDGVLLIDNQPTANRINIGPILPTVSLLNGTIHYLTAQQGTYTPGLYIYSSQLWVKLTPNNITSITAGVGITGGGNSGEVTISIDGSVVATTAVTTALQNEKLSKSGGILNGELSLSNNRITNVGSPTNNSDVANKLYVDTAISNSAVSLSSLPASTNNNDGVFFVTVDNSGNGFRLTKSSINVSQFNNDANYIPASQKGAALGVASLGPDQKVLSSQLPAIAITDTFVKASEAEMLATVCEVGDVVVRTDISSTFILQNPDPTVLSNWIELQVPTSGVISINGLSGNITLADLNLENVDNTADIDKPISNPTINYIDNIVKSSSVAIGQNTNAVSTSVAIGSSSQSLSNNSIALGHAVIDTNNENSIVISTDLLITHSSNQHQILMATSPNNSYQFVDGAFSLNHPVAHFKLPVYETVNLPSAIISGDGAIVYDTTVNSIKISDGVTWNSPSVDTSNFVQTSTNQNINGIKTFNNQISFTSGNATAPSIRWSTTDSGIYSPNGVATTITAGGVNRLSVGTSNVGVFVNLEMSNNKIRNLGLATQDTEATSVLYLKNYTPYKYPVSVATTNNITLSGLYIIDGVALTSGMRVLVKNQTDAKQNGIYEASSGSWSRSADTLVPTTQIMSGMFVFVEQGTANANTGYVLITTTPASSIVYGITPLTFVKFTGGGSGTSTPAIVGELSSRNTGYTIDPTMQKRQTIIDGNAIIVIPNDSSFDFSLPNNEVFQHHILHRGNGIVTFQENSGVTLINQPGYFKTMSEAGQHAHLYKSTTEPNTWFLTGLLDVDGAQNYWTTVTNNAYVPPPTPDPDNELLVYATFNSPNDSLAAYATHPTNPFKRKYVYDYADVHAPVCSEIDWNPINNLLAIGGETPPRMVVYDTTTTPWTQRTDLTDNSDNGITNLRFSSDGEYLVVACVGAKPSKLVYPTQIGRPHQELMLDHTTMLCFTKQNNRIIGCDGNSISLYKFNIDGLGVATRDTTIYPFHGDVTSVKDLDANPAYDVLAMISTIGGINRLQFYNSITDAYLGEVDIFIDPTNEASRMRWSHDGKLLVIAYNNKLTLFSFTNPMDVSTVTYIPIQHNNLNYYNSGLSFSRGGRWLAASTSSYNNYYNVFDLSTMPGRVYNVPSFSLLGSPSLGSCFVSSGSFGLNSVIDTTPPPPAVNPYWISLIGADLEYTWANNQWEHPTNTSPATYGLQPTNTGPFVGWEHNYTPNVMYLTVNSGTDQGNAGYLSSQIVRVFDTNGTMLGQTMFNFNNYNEDLNISVPLTFNPYNIFDIGSIVFISYLYNTGPIIKGDITFDFVAPITATTDLFWVAPSDAQALHYTYDINYGWQHAPSGDPNDNTVWDLIPVSTGNVGWLTNIRPSSMTIIVDSGFDYGNRPISYSLTDNNITVRDTSGNVIGSTDFVFTGYNEQVIVEIPLTFLTDPIGMLSVSSTIFTTGPIILSIDLNA